MSSKLYMLESGNTSAGLTSETPLIVTGTNLRCLLQIAPTVGIEVVEWGISFNASAAATPGQVDLVEVDVAATAGVASVVPVSYITASISATTNTIIPINSSLQPVGASSTYQVGVVNFGGYGQALTGNPSEQMQVTGGGSTTSLSVIRGVNDTPAITSAPVGTMIYALPGTGVYSDIQPYSSQPNADPTYGLVCNTGVGLTGFSFGSYNSPLRIRQGDVQLLPPTAPYVKQFPLERGFEIQPGRFGQIRCTMPGSVSAQCYMIFQV